MMKPGEFLQVLLLNLLWTTFPLWFSGFNDGQPALPILIERISYEIASNKLMLARGYTVYRQKFGFPFHLGVSKINWKSYCVYFKVSALNNDRIIILHFAHFHFILCTSLNHYHLFVGQKTPTRLPPKDIHADY